MKSICFAFVCVFVLSAAFVEAKTPNSKPHIVIIVADDFGWGDAGYHGAPFPTPNIDRVASEGVKLENFYVQPMCTPTRSSLLTGRHPIHYGRQHDVIHPPMPSGLPLNETLLPQILRDNGYTTHAVGKWHLGFFQKEYTPTYRGFDTFFGFYNGALDHFNNVRNSEVGTGYDLRRQDKPAYNKEQIYSSHLYTREAIDVIQNHDQSKPMFLYLAYQACHGPIQAPRYYQDKCAHIRANNAARKGFCAMALTVDEGVNNVTKALEQAGMWNDTLFVFMTDNGAIPANDNNGGSNWPLRGTKFTYFEGGIRIPAFVHGNMLVDSVIGTSNHMLMHVTDLFPTFLEAAQIEYESPLPLDGVSAWKAINTKQPARDGIRSEILVNIDPVERTWSVISGDLKLIQGHQQAYSWYNAPTGAPGGAAVQPNGNTLVFNITADPYEKVDLSKSHPEFVTQLNAIVNKYRATMVNSMVPDSDSKAAPSRFGGYWSSWKSLYNESTPETVAAWEGDKCVLGSSAAPTVPGFLAF